MRRNFTTFFVFEHSDTGPQCWNYNFSIQYPSTYCIWVYFGLRFISYWLKILLNHSKIMHMNINCKTFKIFCNLWQCKEVKSTWYVMTVRLTYCLYHLGRQGSRVQKIAHRYRDRQSSGKLGNSKQIKVQRIRPGPSNWSFVGVHGRIGP